MIFLAIYFFDVIYLSHVLMYTVSLECCKFGTIYFLKTNAVIMCFEAGEVSHACPLLPKISFLYYIYIGFFFVSLTFTIVLL